MPTRKYLFPLFALGLAAASAAAQSGATGLPPLAATATAPATGPVARVNGETITDTAVLRAFRVQHVPQEKQKEARPGVIQLLVDSALVDQYLVQLKVEVDKKDVDLRLDTIRAEIGQHKEKFEDVLKELMYSEAEFRTHVEADLRWEKFVNDQATDEKLTKFFESNRDTFTGAQVRARHIQIAATTPDAKAAEGVVARLQQMKKEVEAAGAAALAKLPANADAFTKKQMYNETVDAAFADLARNNSICASKAAGGDTSWFERSGRGAESFARAAFSLEPFQISDVVQTKYGYHLILVTDRKPGRDVKFEDVKDRVKDLYSFRLRDAVIAAMRPRAQIEVLPVQGGE